jgi:hypothetical protein
MLAGRRIERWKEDKLGKGHLPQKRKKKKIQKAKKQLTKKATSTLRQYT